MKRIGICALAWSACFAAVLATPVHATPAINGATVETRTFNDCPLSILSVTNNYPASIQISDTMDPLCVGFANLHSFSFSADGGATAAVFNNNSNYHFGADFKIEGPGEGEGGLRISPWYGKFVDGRFMANATTGEIACFGGALPFYSFTVNHGITYTKGTTIHLEATYVAHDLDSGDPATIQYRVVLNGITYDSPVLAFGEQNPNECNPNGLWGMLNDGRVGGYFQPRANTGANLTATWSNITFECVPAVGTPSADGAFIATRTFNDCPLSTLTVSNNYPASVQISDTMDPLCVGFANLHSFSFSEDGGATAADFDNNANYSFGADFKIEGPGEGEGGLRISPWYGQFVDGRFMANATTGEIACFGGALPFYSFTVNHGITYAKGTTIHLEATYRGHDNVSTDPATVQYRVVLNGTTYDSPVLAFGEQNPNECVHGLWGMLNDGRVGGYFQPRANTGANLTATWSNITYSNCMGSLEVAIAPHTLNLNSNGKYVTAFIEPATIDVASLQMNGVSPAAGAPTSVGDHDADGIPDVAVKFPRSAVVATLSPGDAVTVTVTGLAGCDCTGGSDVVRVIGSPLQAPVAGAVLAPGSQTDVAWEPLTGNRPVSLISTFDNGESWGVEVDGLDNSGHYSWTVPEASASQVRVAVVRILGYDATGMVLDDEIAESGTFSIAGATGVGDAADALALQGVSPARGAFTVSFSLPSKSPATLAVFDVGGRQVAAREVGGGTGSHQVTFGERERVAPGVYLLRLAQDGRSVTTRVVLVNR